MKISEIIEFEKIDPETSDIHWVAGALTKRKDERRPHVKFIHVKDGEFTATDGSRIHTYESEVSCKDGFYSVIKRCKSNVILRFEGATEEYPEFKSLLNTEGHDETIYAYADLGNCSGSYAGIVHAMKAGTLNYDFLKDLFSEDDGFDVFIKDAESPIIFKNGKKTAVLMPMRTDNYDQNNKEV